MSVSQNEEAGIKQPKNGTNTEDNKVKQSVYRI